MQTMMEDHKTKLKKNKTNKQPTGEAEGAGWHQAHAAEEDEAAGAGPNNKNLNTALHKQAPGEEEGQGRGTGCTGPEVEGPHKTKTKQ